MRALGKLEPNGRTKFTISCVPDSETIIPTDVHFLKTQILLKPRHESPGKSETSPATRMCRADQQHSPTHYPALPDASSNNTTLHKAKKKKQEQMLTNSDGGWIIQVKRRKVFLLSSRIIVHAWIKSLKVKIEE